MDICEIYLFELQSPSIEKNTTRGVHGVQFPKYNYLDNIIIKHL